MNYDKFRQDIRDHIDDNLEIIVDEDERGPFSYAVITDKGIRRVMECVIGELGRRMRKTR